MLALIIGITVTGIMGNVLPAPVVPDIVADFGEPVGRAGWLLAVTTGPGILLAPVIGVLADRFGRREVLVPCLAIFGVAGGLAAWAPSYEWLLVLRFFQGIGSAGLINLGIVLIGDHWSGAERVRMIGRNAAALTAAIVILPPIGGWLGETWSWRATFVPYWLALATAAVVWVRLLGGRRGEGSIREQVRVAAPILRRRAVLAPVLLGAVVFMLIFGVFLTAVPIHLDREFAVGSGGRGLVLALPALTSTTVALNLARLRRRFTVPAILGVAFVLFAVAFATLAVAPSIAFVYAAALVYGAGEGATIATLQDAVSEAAPAASRAAVVAVWVGVARIGQTVGPLAAAAGVDGPGPGPTFAVAAVIGGLLALSTRWLLGEGKLAAATNQ
ncbi:MAG TPA: MFS transporter [Acidimicrobiales bacterium]|jgi:predicted MFS family arabinose efflux permease